MPSTDPAHWYARPAARRWRAGGVASALAFHQGLSGYAPTPLVELPPLAAELGAGRVLLKDESNRLGLPAFKILGASWAVCRALCERFGLPAESATVPGLRRHLETAVPGPDRPVLVTATDGNHGRAVARMAALLGLTARVYVPRGLGGAALDAIRTEGADVRTVDATYDEVVAAAAGSTRGRARDCLVQDTAWAGYIDVPRWIVDGYTTLFAEVDAALARNGCGGPDLVVCPVGVGSLAQAVVEHYRARDDGAPSLLGVEPETAACLTRSLLAGRPVTVDTSFPTIMSGLNCGTPSALAWPSLREGMDGAVTVSEDQCRRAVADLGGLGQDVGPCGAATLAGVRAVLSGAPRRHALSPAENSVVVLISTEGLAANPIPAPGAGPAASLGT